MLNRVLCELKYLTNSIFIYLFVFYYSKCAKQKLNPNFFLSKSTPKMLNLTVLLTSKFLGSDFFVLPKFIIMLMYVCITLFTLFMCYCSVLWSKLP